MMINDTSLAQRLGKIITFVILCLLFIVIITINVLPFFDGKNDLMDFGSFYASGLKLQSGENPYDPNSEYIFDISFAQATGLVERFVDLLALIVISSVSLSLTGIISTALRNALISMSIIGATGLIVIMFSPYFKKQLNWIALSIPFLSTSTREKVLGLLDQFLRGFEALHYPGRIASLILFTLLLWTVDAIGTVFLAHTLHLKIFLIQAFLLLATLRLSSAIPSTPEYIGVYQFVAIMVLKPFGISSAKSLAFIVFSQIMNFLAVTIWGVIAILKRSRL
jgi:uncharacterized protein (TIRG00374 family)